MDRAVGAVPARAPPDAAGRGTLLQLADDFVAEFTVPGRLHRDDDPDSRWIGRYPGW